MASPETPPERHAGGLWCREVMDLLPDFVEGTLAPEQGAAIHAHVSACDWCARFGGHYAGVVQALRGKLAEPEAVPDDVVARLNRALEGL